MNKVILLFNTLKFLKFIQIYFRFYYFVRSKFRIIVGFKYQSRKTSKSHLLILKRSIFSYPSYFGKNKFQFLNIEHDFKTSINWDYMNYGKLWTYNLNYFEFLTQEDSYDFSEIIDDYITKQEEIKTGFEPFPMSLRGINWIKYLNYNKINNPKIDDTLYAQYYRLKDNLEYHLLGNHLLENAFSLLFAAYYFQDKVLYLKAKEILLNELEEQVLDDGGHFELSPMYHQIMLFRLLDVVNLVQNNKWKNDELLMFLIQKAELMLSWLENITYRNGDIPLVNDSTNGIAPSSKELFTYALSLNILSVKRPLSSSGYRKIVKENYEALVDVGSIGAAYIPGHVHSDTLSFEIYKNDKPFIVDTGLSTYQSNERRLIERSTSSHNTVEINGLNQTQVWGGFRVAKRANILYLEEKENYIRAAHDGYSKYNIIHSRVWKFREEEIVIVDSLNRKTNAISYLHFYPSISKREIEESISLNSQVYELLEYTYAKGFNTLTKAWRIKIKFNDTLEVKISIK